MIRETPALWGARQDYPRRCVHDLFEDQVRRTPDAVALNCEERTITYFDLHRHANNLALQLRGAGTTNETIVGVFLENSTATVVSLLAILKAGGAFLPLDREQPAERLAYILHDAKPVTIVTNAEIQHLLPADSPRLLLNPLETAGDGNVKVLKSESTVQSAACVLYTSGSAGRPKGVVRDHSAIVSRLAWTAPSLDAVYCHNMSLTVGLSQERLFVPLMCGRPLVMIPPEISKDAAQLAQTLDRTGVTEITFAPPRLREFLEYLWRSGARLNKIRNVGVGGDLLPRELIELFSLALPHAVLWNNYGSTEVGTVTRGAMTRTAGSAPVSIGRPLPNVRVHILDPAMQPVPHGVSGELYVAAPSLARGYLHKPELTAKRFVSSPFDPETRLFRTGDLARFLLDGEIELAGRGDRQVKIRGYRVELAEVEAALESHPHVEAAAAVAWGEEGEKRLVAYTTCTKGSIPSASQFRRHLRGRLPDPMVPSAFVTLENMPRALNGKIDVSALPPPGRERPSLETVYEIPSGPTEKVVADIWADLLNLERVGGFDDFFELGGDSLLAVHMLLRVAEIFQTNAPGSVLAEHSTVRAFAQFLDDPAVRDAARIGAIPRVARDENTRLSITQEINLTGQLAQDIRAIPHGWALLGFGLSLEGDVNVDVFHRAIQEIVRRHEVLRTGFSPVAAVGNLTIRGWKAIHQLFGQGPIKPRIRFEPVITSGAELPLVCKDLRHVGKEEREAAIEETIAHAIGTTYDYASPPLSRAVLLRISDRHHRLIVGVSHLVFDGWSRPIFQRELAVLYQAFLHERQSPLPDLSVQHLDFAHWQRHRLQGERLRDLLEYWEQHYLGFPSLEAQELLFARGKDTDSRSGGAQFIALDTALCLELRAFAAASRSTLYMVFVMAVTTLLSAYTRRDKVSVASYFANRTHPAIQDLIGDFANAHRLGVDFSDNPHVLELLHQIRSTVAGVTAHQEIPVALLLNLLGRSGKFAAHQLPAGPWITCEFIAHKPIASPEGLAIKPVGLLTSLSSVPASQPLRFICRDSGTTEITLSISYHTHIFEQAAVQGMLSSLVAILRQALAAPNARVSELSKSVAAIPEQAGRVRLNR